MRAILVVACLAASLVAEPAQAQLIGAARAPGGKYMILASKLSGQGKHQELIREIQPHIDVGEHMPSTVLWLLGMAYYEVRNYRGLLATADVMDRNIISRRIRFYSVSGPHSTPVHTKTSYASASS